MQHFKRSTTAGISINPKLRRPDAPSKCWNSQHLYTKPFTSVGFTVSSKCWNSEMIKQPTTESAMAKLHPASAGTAGIYENPPTSVGLAVSGKCWNSERIKQQTTESAMAKPHPASAGTAGIYENPPTSVGLTVSGKCWNSEKIKQPTTESAVAEPCPASAGTAGKQPEYIMTKLCTYCTIIRDVSTKSIERRWWIEGRAARSTRSPNKARYLRLFVHGAAATRVLFALFALVCSRRGSTCVCCFVCSHSLCIIEAHCLRCRCPASPHLAALDASVFSGALMQLLR